MKTCGVAVRTFWKTWLLAAFTPVFYSVWSCFTQDKKTEVCAKQFAFDPTTFKVEENSRTFQACSRTCTEIQGLFKEKWNSRTFQERANPGLERRLEPWSSKFSSFKDRVKTFEFRVIVNLHLTGTVSYSYRESESGCEPLSLDNGLWKAENEVTVFIKNMLMQVHSYVRT